jgi:3-phenylpropionate/cinnamic acid dioxygenase small subunit
MMERMSNSTTLEDKDAIRELLARYCFLLDGFRLGEFAALFASDGEWISRNGSATGPEAIERLLRGLVPEPAPGKRRKHFTANIIIDLAGDSAKVISNFLVVRDSEKGPAIAVAGTYDDMVVRTAEGWKFKSRRLSHDIAGESGLNPGPG